MSPTPDPVMIELAEAVAVRTAGDHEAARERLDALWTRIGGEDGDPLHRCAVAHSMADAQDDLREELRWDERAIAAAAHVTDERTASAGMAGGAAALFPSLHLNLALCHEKLGEADQARMRLRRCEQSLDRLPDDEYGAFIREAHDQLERRLSGTGAPSEDD